MMKVSNMNIPVKAENNPKAFPAEIDTQKTSVFYGCRDPYILLSAARLATTSKTGPNRKPFSPFRKTSTE